MSQSKEESRRPPQNQQQRPQQSEKRQPEVVGPGLPAVMRNLPALERPMFRDVDTLRQQIVALREKVHLLSPTMDPAYVPEFHEVSIRLVPIDDRLETQGGTGDVYKGQGWKDHERALTRNALNRIAAAAGVRWDPVASGRVDDGSDPNYVHFRAVGWVRDLDGSRRPITGEKQIDLRDGNPNIFTEDPQRMAREYDERARRYTDQIKNPGFVKGWSAQRLTEARAFILEMAESKAKNRVVRSLGVRQKYTVQELQQKPFAVLALVLTGASDDPVLEQRARERMLDAAIGATFEIYGADAQRPSLPPPAAAAPAPAPAIERQPPPPVGAAPERDEDDEPGDVIQDGEIVCGCPDGPAGIHEPDCPEGDGR